jgi:hypothetical protein
MSAMTGCTAALERHGEGRLRAESRPANPSSLGSKPQIVTLTGRINWDRFRDQFYILESK